MSWVAECGRSKPSVDFGRIERVLESAQQGLVAAGFWRVEGDPERDEEDWYAGFLALNTDADGLGWNVNDLRFGAWAAQRHARRRVQPGFAVGPPESEAWGDPARRAELWRRFCSATCTHARWISGRHYVTLGERLDEARRRRVKPRMEMTLAEELEDPSDRLIREALEERLERERAAAREHQELEVARWQTLRDRCCSREGPTRVLDDVASLVAHHWLTAESDAAPATPVETPELHNGDCDGWWFTGSPLSEFQVLAHGCASLRLEERFLARPARACPARPETEARLAALVAERTRTQIANETLQEVSRLLCDLSLPAGAKTYVRRRTRRSMVPTDVMLQLCVGTNATLEILAALDNEVRVREVALDPRHPLFEVVALAVIETIVLEDDERAMFYQEVVLLPSDLLDQRAALWSTESMCRERAPLMLRAQDQWHVDHRGERWTRPGLSFLGAFACWLELMREHHDELTPGDYSTRAWRERCAPAPGAPQL